MTASLNRRTLLGDDSGTARAALVAGVVTPVVAFLFELGFQTLALPAGAPPTTVLLVVVAACGVGGLSCVVAYEWNDILRGAVLGASALGVFGSTLLFLSSVVGVGEDAIVLGLAAIFLGSTALYSYLNDGILVCWALVALPVGGILSVFFYLHGGSFGESYAIGDALARAAAFAGVIAVVFGTVGYLIGLALRRLRPSAHSA